jgi:macrolide transport system ATP-binding/permease protein
MFRRRRGAKDFADEVQAHLDLEADELEAEGHSKAEAHRRARVAFGNVAAAQERFHLGGRVVWLDNLARDWKFALRQLAKNRGFAAAAIFVLALGIGAAVAIFAFVDAALLEPLPYANPSRLMSVNESGANCPRCPLSYPDFLDWQRMNHSFSSLDVYSGTGYLLRAPSGAEAVQAARVSGGFFRTLGIHPMIGRDFSPGEDRLGGPNVLLLSYRTWLNRFGGQRDAVGRTVDLDGTAFTIIGVLPRAFSFGPAGNAEFWVPINTLSPHEHSRDFYNFWGVGRLRDGVNIVAARAEMNSIANLLLREDGPRQLELLGASVIPLSEVIVGDIRPILLVLLGGVVLLLLIACVNVGSLVLARSESRQREIAVRGALGASPARLVQQFITEGFVLALLGCIGGLMAAVGFIRLLGLLVPKDIAANMPFLEGVHLNVHACAFAAAICALAAVLTAATPIFRLSVQKGCDALAEGGRGSVSRFWQRIGANLVVLELIVAVVLLASAGLLTRSLYSLLHIPLGFDPAHLATLQVSLPAIASTDAQTAELYQEISRRVGQLPGVQSVGLTSRYPVECHCQLDSIQVIGKPELNDHNLVDERHISAGYLPTLGATLMRGRLFTDADDSSKPGVAIVNASLARKYFPNQDPIGQRFSNTEGGHPSVWEVVGEIEDVHEGPLDASSEPAEYFPLRQVHDRGFSLVVRTRQDPSAVLPSIAATLHRVDSGIVVSNETTIEDAIDATQAALLHRSSAWLFGGFAGAALILSVVGLYGVIAYSVRQRRREIGVRIALGAQRGAIYALVLGQAGWLIGIGLAFGLISSLGASRLLRSLLFGVNAWDPVTLIGVSALLAVVSLAAVFLPARRAASVHPAEVLHLD